MALFKTSLRMAWDVIGVTPRKWSNSFYVESASAAAAAAFIVASWVFNLRGAARDRVYAYEVYATDLVPGTENYVVQGIPSSDQRGTLSSTGFGEPYLAKAAISVTLNVQSSRPSRKFWRPGLYEGDIINGQTLAPGISDAVTARFAQFLTDSGPALVDPDGQLFSSLGPLRLTTREFGRESTNLVPDPPPLA